VKNALSCSANGAIMSLSVPKCDLLVKASDIIVELPGFVGEVRLSYIYRCSISFGTYDKVLPLNNRYSLSSPIITVRYTYAYVLFFRKYRVSLLSFPGAR
jgi:hypothetical protein